MPASCHLASTRMKWIVHGERLLYESHWMNLALTDVEIPGGDRFEHHVIRAPAGASGTVVVDGERGVLLVWRHRFATDTWGLGGAGRAHRRRRDPRAGRGQGDARGDGLAAGPPDAPGRPTTRTTASRTCGSTCSGPTGRPTWVHRPTGPRSSAVRLADRGRAQGRVATGQVVDGLSLTAVAALAPGLRAGTMSVPSISRLSAGGSLPVPAGVDLGRDPAQTGGDGGEHVVHRLGIDVRGQLTSLFGVVDQAAEERAAAPLQPGDPLAEVLVALARSWGPPPRSRRWRSRGG